MTAPTSAPVDILLVEDNPGDVRLTREALRESRIRNAITVARDGVEAMALLRREGPYATAPRPDLILLDLNLPRKSGREVLREVKEDELLRHIPIVILSSSASEPEILACYRLRANAFVTKPPDLDQYLKVVRSIEQFWLETAHLTRP